MKAWLPSITLACILNAPTSSSATPVVALGDSLTFAYEASFRPQVSIPFVGTFGDGFGPEVRNWVEILGDPVYRSDSFDFGERDEFQIEIIPSGEDFLFRHEYNWALPGLRISELRDFMDGNVTFEDLIASDSDLQLFVGFSDLDTSTAFELSDLEDQIINTAERLVFFIGGNDVRGVYGAIYQGASPAAFVEEFIADAEAILDRVQQLNPMLPVVVVNVPHIGITPDIKSSFPTEPIGTGRVTDALRELNRQLKGLADARGYGYADVFTPTLPMLGDAPFSIQGIPFFNEGSTTGDLDFVWLNGEVSSNFHPNTNGQAIIANAIIDAFNVRYQDGIAPLTATEILGGLHGKTASQIDMSFEDWAASYGLAGLGPDEDADGDGIPAAMEFALGLSPILRDGHKVTTSLRQTENDKVLELAYSIRLPSSTRYTLAPAQSTDLSSFSTITPAPQPGPDGLARAWLPVDSSSGFLRLEVALTPQP